MRLKFTSTVKVPREEAFAWWSDYSEADHEHPDFAGVATGNLKKINIKREGNSVTFDIVGTGRFLGRERRVTSQAKVTLHPLERIDGEIRDPSFGMTEFTYTFEQISEGTRITYVGDLKPRGIVRILTPLIRGRVKRIFQLDHDIHCKDMETDLGFDQV